MNQIIVIILTVLIAFMLIGVGYLFSYYSHKKTKIEKIGTIVVDHSDGAANIFLEIATNDIEKWENDKEYSVKVEIRDYLPQE